MNLHDYFESVRNDTPSDLQKMKIYHSFLDKKQKSLPMVRVRYYLRVATYCLALVAVGAFTYYTFEPSPTGDVYKVAQVEDAYITLQRSSNQIVMADTVGSIKHGEGEIIITKDGQETPLDSDALHDNDKILLKDDAVLEFSVQEGINARIVGPAEFSIQHLGTQKGIDTYAIDLVYGKYVEIASVEELPQEAAPVHVVVNTPNFNLEPLKSDDDLHVIISSQDDGKQTVTNNGDTLVLQKVIDGEQVYTSVRGSQTVEVNGDIQLMDEQDALALAKRLDEQAVEAVYEVREEPTAEQPSTDEPAATDVAATDTLLTDTKKVIAPDAASQLNSALALNRVKDDVHEMVEHYFNGDINAFGVALSNIDGRVGRVYDALDLTVESEIASFYAKQGQAIQGVIIRTDQLIAKIDSTYYM